MHQRDRAAIFVLIEAVLVCGSIFVVRTAWESRRPIIALGFGAIFLVLLSVWLSRRRKRRPASDAMIDVREEEEESPAVISDGPGDKIALWVTVALSILIATWIVVRFVV